MKKKIVPRVKIDVEFEGKKHSAVYTIDSDIVTITSGYGSKSTQSGGSPVEIIARMLFIEILVEARSRGYLH
jgi:hypothetical protein